MKNYSSKIQSIYNQFNGRNLEILDQFYAANVVFADPVVQIEGLGNLKSYYTHAYKLVKSIRFEFSDISHEANRYSCTWTMTLAVSGLNSGKPYSVEGVSILHFNPEGLITYHRDYLDLGAMVYERIPIQGAIVRAIKQRLTGGIV